LAVFKEKNYWGLILGASSGMGLAAAHKLAAAGMNLCLLHRDRRSASSLLEKEWEKLKEQDIELLSFNLDALREENREKVILELKERMGEEGRLRLLLHSISKGNLKAAAPQGGRSFELPAEIFLKNPDLEKLYRQLAEVQKGAEEDRLLGGDDLRLTIEAMATSLYDWVRALFDAALFAPDARVIGMTSEGGRKAWRQYGAVAAAKAVLESLIRTIALEYAPFGIRANAVQAGVTRTPSLDRIPNSDHLKLGSLLRNPMGRLTLPEDVANVIYLLCLDEAAWINGAIIPVDGGESISG
jgi:enoyl-[acyl-carrier protein] reductase III